jgi:hypothetical protein
MSFQTAWPVQVVCSTELYLPALIAEAAKGASPRFVEFSTANILNTNTRAAYPHPAVFPQWRVAHTSRPLSGCPRPLTNQAKLRVCPGSRIFTASITYVF